jgi:hypothetical protein
VFSAFCIGKQLQRRYTLLAAQLAEVSGLFHGDAGVE